MNIWSSPELYASVIAVVGAAALAIFLTAPGRQKAKKARSAQRGPKVRGPLATALREPGAGGADTYGARRDPASAAVARPGQRRCSPGDARASIRRS